MLPAPGVRSVSSLVEPPQLSKQWHVGVACIMTNVKLRGPEGAQRPRATSASTLS